MTTCFASHAATCVVLGRDEASLVVVAFFDEAKKLKRGIAEVLHTMSRSRWRART